MTTKSRKRPLTRMYIYGIKISDLFILNDTLKRFNLVQKRTDNLFQYRNCAIIDH